MKATVPVKNIVPNPFQARKKIDRDAAKALSEEIKEQGLWPGALRGRMRGDKVELVYGHRRLAAIKLLGWKEVEVEIEDLSDEEMASQNLAENLQRENLTDIEKAEAIHMMVQRAVRGGTKEPEALTRIAKSLGLSSGWVKDLLSLRELERPVQKAIREKEIAGRTALEAHRLGGQNMVQTAIDKKLPVHKLSAIAQKLRRIPDEEVREKVRSEVVRGRLVAPEDVQAKARQLMKGRTLRAPADLDRTIAEWTKRLRAWSQELDELVLYRQFLKEPGRGDVLRAEAARLVGRLQKF